MVDADSPPEGYQSITSYFTVADADLLIRFLAAAFDACVFRESRYEDNRILHARLRIGNGANMRC